MNKRLAVRARRYSVRFLIYSLLGGPFIISGVEVTLAVTRNQPYRFITALVAAIGGVLLTRMFWKWVDSED